MIKKGDILVYAECLEEGDENCLMISLEDESTHADVPMVKVKELNTDLKYPPVNFFEASNYKVVGHVEESDTTEELVKRFISKKKWNIS